jgi:hypothetical protein
LARSLELVQLRDNNKKKKDIHKHLGSQPSLISIRNIISNDNTNNLPSLAAATAQTICVAASAMED